MSKEIEAAVAAILDRDGIKFSAVLRGETKRDDWSCDEWFCTFDTGRKPEQMFEFYTGLGHRKRTEAKERAWQLALAVNPPSPRSLMYEAMLKANPPIPQPPPPASVLYSLLLDSEAETRRFSDWCADYDYSDDSIKARNLWEDCIRNSQKLHRIFNRAQIEELRTALDGY